MNNYTRPFFVVLDDHLYRVGEGYPRISAAVCQFNIAVRVDDNGRGHLFPPGFEAVRAAANLVVEYERDLYKQRANYSFVLDIFPRLRKTLGNSCSSEDVKHECVKIENWVKSNIPLGRWRQDVSEFYFGEEDDAFKFRLRFGV